MIFSLFLSVTVTGFWILVDAVCRNAEWQNINRREFIRTPQDALWLFTLEPDKYKKTGLQQRRKKVPLRPAASFPFLRRALALSFLSSDRLMMDLAFPPLTLLPCVAPRTNP